MVGSFSRSTYAWFLQDDISLRDNPEAWGFAHLSQSSNIFIS
jgi:hypothetical protein